MKHLYTTDQVNKCDCGAFVTIQSYLPIYEGESVIMNFVEWTKLKMLRRKNIKRFGICNSCEESFYEFKIK